MYDRVKAIIHLTHLKHNFQLLRRIHQDKRVMAVVKADAYGHGAIKTAVFLEANGCDFFAVTDLLEGIELRQAGIQSPILIFGKTSPEHIHQINEYDLIQTVDSLAYAIQLNQKEVSIPIHMILDTGMSRFGLYCHQEKDQDQTVQEIEKILGLSYLKMQGVYTHFAVADEAKDLITKHQYQMFNDVVTKLESKGYDLGIKHCSNSASTLKFPLHQMDMIRSGIALYGYPPVETDLAFLPVMEVFAKVIALRQVKPGDGISYGLTFQVEKPMQVASIAIGYADGYFRMFSAKDYFYYKGHKLPVLGRVCMGVTMVDATGIDLAEGDEVEVFGIHKPLEDMAKIIGTITYELLTSMRKHRVYYDYQK
jgi:alanine racemase